MQASLTLPAMSNLTKERSELLIINASTHRTFPENEPVRIRENDQKQTPSFVTFASGSQHRGDRGIPDSSGLSRFTSDSLDQCLRAALQSSLFAFATRTR